jgi:hypothetical protein
MRFLQSAILVMSTLKVVDAFMQHMHGFPSFPQFNHFPQFGSNQDLFQHHRRMFNQGAQRQQRAQHLSFIDMESYLEIKISAPGKTLNDFYIDRQEDLFFVLEKINMHEKAQVAKYKLDTPVSYKDIKADLSDNILTLKLPKLDVVEQRATPSQQSDGVVLTPSISQEFSRGGNSSPGTNSTQEEKKEIDNDELRVIDLEVDENAIYPRKEKSAYRGYFLAGEYHTY